VGSFPARGRLGVCGHSQYPAPYFALENWAAPGQLGRFNEFEIGHDTHDDRQWDLVRFTESVHGTWRPGILGEARYIQFFETHLVKTFGCASFEVRFHFRRIIDTSALQYADCPCAKSQPARNGPKCARVYGQTHDQCIVFSVYAVPTDCECRKPIVSQQSELFCVKSRAIADEERFTKPFREASDERSKLRWLDQRRLAAARDYGPIGPLGSG